MDINKLFSEENICFLIHKISAHLKVAALQTFKAHNCITTPEQWALLMLLSVKDGQYQRQLAKSLLKDRPNITRIIDLLESKQLVIRKQDEDNKRKFRIFLTEEGRKIATDYRTIAQSIATPVYNELTEEEGLFLQKILCRIFNNMNKELNIQI